ncbi:TetR/AcrR family transcriptional regulator [Actinocorallia sp. A-T 12471]|uniref:TetR/AcrR family transcriptional regulator n=1 Tax=Actinocorallia sp. A-T 12471 TaxID=3089813 RepID=UPI0029CD486A|nr:TetR family transcriptional regulator [Actinocorallia sp. A-T 12471]MDX6739967.1 TetR family transcriptional regulator [Actinocorallia sp. A-T 12471]
MTDNPGPSRRVPRAEVRRRLLAEAVRVFTERGYADARIEDIAHAAGFTKGAVYSNFGGKHELFGAVLGQGAQDELAAVTAGMDGADDAGAVIERVAGLMAARIATDTGHGQLGLEFAARAARDEQTRAVLAPMRRAQRDAAARAVAEVAERTGAGPAVPAELAGLILHCLTNGLVNEHLADPETVTADVVERAFAAVLTALLAPASHG